MNGDDIFWQRWVRAAVLLAAAMAALWLTKGAGSLWLWVLETLAALGVFYCGARVLIGLGRGLWTLAASPVRWVIGKTTGTIHGSARFQSGREIKGGNLARGGSVYLGGWRDWQGRTKPLASDGRENILVVGSSRSGKGAGVIIPSLLGFKGSAVVYDEKSELCEVTRSWREREAGNLILTFEPGSPTSATKFNFLSAVRLGSPYMAADALNIATTLCDDELSGEAAHWRDTARELIAGAIIHCLGLDPAASLADVAGRLRNPKQTADEFFEEMKASAHPFVAGAGTAQCGRNERERSSVTSTVLRILSIFSDPIIAANTSGGDGFSLAVLADGDKPTTVYLIVRAPDVVRLRPLVRLFFTVAMLHLMSAPLRFDAKGRSLPAHKHPVLLVLDEFASLGKMEIVEQALARCLGYGVSAIVAAQDISQLHRAYGQHQNVSNNCNLRVLFPPNEVATAEWISKQLGTATVSTDMRSRSRPHIFSAFSRGGGSSVSDSVQHTARQLLLADEIMTLPKLRDGKPGKVLIVEAGKRAILANQLLYWQDAEMQRRATGGAGPATPAEPFAANDNMARVRAVASIAAAIVLPLALLGSLTGLAYRSPAPALLANAGSQVARMASTVSPTRLASLGPSALAPELPAGPPTDANGLPTAFPSHPMPGEPMFGCEMVISNMVQMNGPDNHACRKYYRVFNRMYGTNLHDPGSADPAIAPTMSIEKCRGQSTFYPGMGLPFTDDCAKYIPAINAENAVPWPIGKTVFNYSGNSPLDREFAAKCRAAIAADRTAGLPIVARCSKFASTRDDH